MNIQRVNLEDLKCHEDNYNEHPLEQIDEIIKSLKQFGQFKNIVTDENNTILAGHGLVLAMQELGWKYCFAEVKTGLNEDEKKALMIADNVLPQLAVVDFDKLKKLYEPFKLNKISIPGLTLKKLKELHLNDTINQQNDIDNDIKDIFEVVITCGNEMEQEKTFNNLINEGYKCRILTL